MLDLRPCCEHCGKDLPPESTEAMICTFECTYCRQCALELFRNVCPSCSGNFVERPIRPKKYLTKYPPSRKRVFVPKKLDEVEVQIKEYEHVLPQER